MSKRGRKIYHTSAGNRKRKVKKVFGVLFFIVLLAALVFVGYIVGSSIHDYFKGKPDNEDKTEAWTPPVFTGQTDSGGESGEDVPAGEDEPEQEENRITNGFSAYQLPVSALESQEKLLSALNELKGSGYTAVAVTLKAEGGKLYYKTGSAMAATCETAVTGDMYAGQIAAMIRNAGYTSIAKVNLLEDHNFYSEYKTGAYRFSGSTSTWYDNSVEKGGKPWLSPFDADTQEYAEYLGGEAGGAGFDMVVFDGIVFPPFRNSDLNYIGSIVKSPDRYKALINIADMASGAAERGGAHTAVTISANDVLNGTAELLKPEELTVKTIVVEFFPAEFPTTVMLAGEEAAIGEFSAYEKTIAVFTEIKRMMGEEYTLIPELRYSELSQADLNDIITALMDMDIESYVIIG